MATNYNPKITTDGLIMYLDAANSKSYPGTGNTWYDLSGNSRNAIKAGSQSPTYPQWNSSGYFTFNGGVVNNNYSRFDVSMPNLSAISIITFQYATAYGGHVLRHSDSDYQIGPNGYTAGTNWNDISCSRLDVIDSWISDALTFDGINLFGYRNGTQYSSKIRGSSTGMAEGTLRIGARSDIYTAHFFGNISLVIVYNKALSATEITQNFNALRGRYGI